MSNKYNLNKEDLKSTLHNAMIFSAPFFLTGLLALQSGVDWKIALTMIGQAFLTSLIDLTRKFIAENK